MLHLAAATLQAPECLERQAPTWEEFHAQVCCVVSIYKQARQGHQGAQSFHPAFIIDAWQLTAARTPELVSNVCNPPSDAPLKMGICRAHTKTVTHQHHFEAGPQCVQLMSAEAKGGARIRGWQLPPAGIGPAVHAATLWMM